MCLEVCCPCFVHREQIHTYRYTRVSKYLNVWSCRCRKFITTREISAFPASLVQKVFAYANQPTNQPSTFMFCFHWRPAGSRKAGGCRCHGAVPEGGCPRHRHYRRFSRHCRSHRPRREHFQARRGICFSRAMLYLCRLISMYARFMEPGIRSFVHEHPLESPVENAHSNALILLPLEATSLHVHAAGFVGIASL